MRFLRSMSTTRVSIRVLSAEKSENLFATFVVTHDYTS